MRYICPLSALLLCCIALSAAPVAAVMGPVPLVAPVASFSASPTGGAPPLNVSFTDTTSGSPTGWAWYFGDQNYTVSAWTQQSAGAGWSGRKYHAGVVLPDGSIVLMGGWGASSTLKNDVWRSTDRGITWTCVNASAGWTPRYGHASVVLPDGSIVLMGGNNIDNLVSNDVWRSTDMGSTWTLQTDHAGWSGPYGRYGHTSVALPDGSIVLMGDAQGGKNDVWRSTDKGVTWTPQTNNAGWPSRRDATSVVLPDGSIVLMGGTVGADTGLNDVWRSVDRGANWTRQTEHAAWSARNGPTSVALPDGSIILMGGNLNDDVWRSTDMGVTWSAITAGPRWSGRYHTSSVALPDGSIVIMGGSIKTSPYYVNDAWRLETASSHAQNPQHVYAAPGIYSVALQAYNPAGYSALLRTGHVTVATVLAVPPGNALPTDTDGDGKYDDVNGNGRKDFADVVLYFNQMSWIGANEPAGCLDFNGNTRVDFADVVWLFNCL